MSIRSKIVKRIYWYSVDNINDRQIRGWCFHRLKKDRPVKLAFYADEHRLGEATASQMRPDLAAHSLHPTGRCGFEFQIPEHCNIGGYRKLSITTVSGNTRLVEFQTSEIPRVIRGPLPKVLFMHIPKTAGTSFNTFARAYFPPDRVVTQVQTENIADYPRFNADYHFISGHFTLGSMKQHFDLDSFKLYTILREPYRHLHSHFNWVKAIAEVPDSGFLNEHPEVVQNLARRMQHLDLNKAEVLDEFVQNLEGFELEFFDNLQTRYFLEQRTDRISSEHLDRALNNLRHFTAIGLTEAYRDFTRLFCEQIGAVYCEQKAPLNKAQVNNLFDLGHTDIRQALQPLVQTDLLLYEQVKNNFPGD